MFSFDNILDIRIKSTNRSCENYTPASSFRQMSFYEVCTLNAEDETSTLPRGIGASEYALAS